ncbi:hypothetical protein V2J09_018384 [Rumex salicifolius]
MAVSLWVISYVVGSLCDFITLVYVVIYCGLLCLSLPMLYDKYQDLIDEKMLYKWHCPTILSLSESLESKPLITIRLVSAADIRV